jgi:hypothetical protein
VGGHHGVVANRSDQTGEARILVDQRQADQIVEGQIVVGQTAGGQIVEGRTSADQRQDDQSVGGQTLVDQSVGGQTLVDQTLADLTRADPISAPTWAGRILARRSDRLVSEGDFHETADCHEVIRASAGEPIRLAPVCRDYDLRICRESVAEACRA